MNHEQIYYLMHRNDIVTTLSMDMVTGSIVAMGKLQNKELLPPGGNLSPNALRKWWERRAVPLNQGKICSFLHLNKIVTPQNYLLQNLGLSLSDHYWINPAEEFLKWENVNLFTNDFKDSFGDFQFKDSLSSENVLVDMRHRTIFYPSASLQGELCKKWVVQNGRRYLIKANHGLTCQQSINEAIAKLMHEKQQKVPYTQYRLCDIEVENEAAIGCACEDFCTEEIEFVPAYEVMESAKKRNEQSEYERFIAVCVEHELDEKMVRSFLEYQILSDFVLTNVDRHFYNFGVLRDTRTLKYIGMAPIFDSGNSMFWNRLHVPKGQELLDIDVNSFKRKEIQLLEYVKDVSILDHSKLPTEEEVRKLLLLDPKSAERCEAILEGYEGKKELLRRFQEGEKIYQYGYRI